jgi:hypothetical protein
MNNPPLATSEQKTLPQTFTYDGFTFRLVRRHDQVAVFAKTKPTHHRETYEVIIVLRHPAETICGRNYQARESMPPSEAWGTSGWTYTELAKANAKFDVLVEGRWDGHSQPAATPAGAFSSSESVTAKPRP